ncbi:MAG TPA: three-Cys-motif partner protein TcmP [Bryobacteraceae bacterium]|nr:three-Cys-motif partner protein TcmP [Bryobacteraceae bacterium]
MGSTSDSLRVDDDGSLCAVVGNWAEEKYRILALYDELFSSGMKNKWDQRVYIDLYAGGGFSRVEGTRRLLKGSPIIALTVTCRFDKYIFCEESGALLAALKARSERFAPDAEVRYILGNCDANIGQIVQAIPKASPENRVLSLCIVDPFDFGLKFESLKELSKMYMDFVVLLAIGMDANRNYDHYVEGHSSKIDEALGNAHWRERWKAAGTRRSDFRRFLATEFSRSMESLGYLPTRYNRMKWVRSDEKNLPLYCLALFSRHRTAHRFWDEVLKYGTDQPDLPFE